MARANLITVKNMVYDSLAVRSGSYGTFDSTNQRYPTAYIDDQIIAADIEIIKFLLKNKQNQFLYDLYTKQASVTSGTAVVNNWDIIQVQILGHTTNAVEISVGMFDEMSAGGIYDNVTYNNYYCIDSGTIRHFGTTADITYLDLTHPTSLTVLKAPTGFETAVADLATARCLIKRNDKPDEQKMRMDAVTTFLSQFMSPDSNHQVEVDA